MNIQNTKPLFCKLLLNHWMATALLMSLVFSLPASSSDTLIICQGESIQLLTTPNQLSYSWSPNVNISDLTIYNPTVQPEVTTTYLVRVEPVPNINLVRNGDFSQGNIGFASDYNYTPNGTYQQGFYGIFTSPAQFNGGFGDCSDHSPSADDLMMVVDGATEPDENVWCQTVGVVPGRVYDFSAWITNVHPTEPSLLQFSINDVPLGDELEVDDMLCFWEEFSEAWYSANHTTATICITNQSTIPFGNDFAIDDIRFSLTESAFVDTFTVIVLENADHHIDTSICANLLLPFAGELVPADTQLVFQYSAYNGCDSLVFLNVAAIDTSYTETRIDTLCPGDTIYYFGVPITRDTVICDIFTNYLGCDSSICFVAYFLSEATISIKTQLPSCAGLSDGELAAMPFAGLPPWQYFWSTGSTSADISGLQAGTYALTLTDAKGCLAEKSIALTEPPELTFDADVMTPSCFGGDDGRVLLLPSGGTGNFVFTFGERATSAYPLFEQVEAGTYSLLIEDENGCELDTSIHIRQPAPIVISLPRDTSLPLGCAFELRARISASQPYQSSWSPAIGLDCIQCASPLARPFEDIVYQLLVTDSNGCQAEASIQLSLIKNYDLFIPNVFSPNADGINDYFELFAGKDVAEVLSFQVYDRWGALVFQHRNSLPGDPECRWDGRFRGEQQEIGVFVYVIKIRFIDGHEALFSGDVLLVR